MTESDEAPVSPTGMPHIPGHRHSDVSGGWLRAATFGAMDGLVSNTALIAGVAASASAHTVVLSGVAGLLAGAFSMALGEYTSVSTANEQLEAEVRTERRALSKHPEAEKTELVWMLVEMGMTPETAETAGRCAWLSRPREDRPFPTFPQHETVVRRPWGRSCSNSGNSTLRAVPQVRLGPVRALNGGGFSESS